jgi:hypothetical protein
MVRVVFLFLLDLFLGVDGPFLQALGLLEVRFFTVVLNRWRFFWFVGSLFFCCSLVQAEVSGAGVFR